MAAPTTPEEALEQAVLGPQSVTNADGQSVTGRPIKDLLDARNAMATTAATKPAFGLRMTKLIPPGAG